MHGAAGGMTLWWQNAYLEAQTDRLHPVHGATIITCPLVVSDSARGTRFRDVSDYHISLKVLMPTTRQAKPSEPEGLALPCLGFWPVR